MEAFEAAVQHPAHHLGQLFVVEYHHVETVSARLCVISTLNVVLAVYLRAVLARSVAQRV